VATEHQREVFKALLKSMREDAGLTQRQLAARMEVDASTVAQWEIGRSAPREELAAKLEHVLDADPPGVFRVLLGFAVRDDLALPGIVTFHEVTANDRWLTDEQRLYLRTLHTAMTRHTRQIAAARKDHEIEQALAKAEQDRLDAPPGDDPDRQDHERARSSAEANSRGR